MNKTYRGEQSKLQTFKGGKNPTCDKHGTHSEWTTHFSGSRKGAKKREMIVCLKCRRQYDIDRRQDPTVRLWGYAKQRARKNGLAFSITQEDVKEKLMNQGDICAVTGLSFIDRDKHYTRSLDRIDSSKGYIKDNIQLVLNVVNKMKTNLHEDEFFSICEEVIRNKSK